MSRELSSSTEHRAPLRPRGLDCLECAGGVYTVGEAPFCSYCGAPAPQAAIDTMRQLAQTAAA